MSLDPSGAPSLDTDPEQVRSSAAVHCRHPHPDELAVNPSDPNAERTANRRTSVSDRGDLTLRYHLDSDLAERPSDAGQAHGDQPTPATVAA